MSEIGFGQHFTWHNGSGGCAYTREEAARKLPKVIKAHHDAYRVVRGLMYMVGLSAHEMAISAPIGALIALVREAAEYLDISAYELTKTWQVASDVIQAHLHAGASEGTDTEMWAPNACIDYWTPKVREASGRLDRMGFQAEDWLHGGPIVGRKRKL